MVVPEKSYLLSLTIVSLLISLFFYWVALPKSLAATNTNSNANQNTNSNSNSNVNQNSNGIANQNDNTNAAQRQQEIQKKQQQLNSVQTQINTFQKSNGILDQKSETIKDMLSNLNDEITTAETAVNQTEKSLAAVQQQLNDKNHDITLKEDDIDKRKDFLEEYMRQLDLIDKRSVVEVVLTKNSLSDFFQEAENIVVFEQRLGELLADLNTERTGLVQEKDGIEEQKNEQLSLYALQEEQKAELDKDKKDREDLLAETQNEQVKIQDLIDKGSAVAGRLSAEITALQSCGVNIDFGQALAEAKIVSQLTGVRAAFLLGVLKVESNMGSNVGGGTYKNDMNPVLWDRFKSICSELGYDPDKQPVSRKPCYRNSSGNCSGWGGAMGPAQMMPSTWMGYREQVAQVTGHQPANPWNLQDALTSMGLKLAKVSGVTDHDRGAEHKAASIYLAGGNWANFGWYGDRVLKFADQYEKQIN
jgi:peptidoglycan hydrolase CwlO-like protein